MDGVDIYHFSFKQCRLQGYTDKSGRYLFSSVSFCQLMSLKQVLFCNILLFKVIRGWINGNGIKRILLEVGMNIYSAISYQVQRMSHEFSVWDRGTCESATSFMQSSN